MAKLKYKRILLKLSGEVFKGELPSGIDGKSLMGFATEIKKLQKAGVQVGVVIGGGNIWRYRDNKHLTLDRVTSDTIGMLATVMNALALQAALRELKAEVIAVSNLPCEKALENYTPDSARKYMDEGKIVIFAGGTGHPFFTTDSAAALMAMEMYCDALFKATKVSFVYDKDPMKFKDAKKYTKLSYQEVIEKNLGVMDLTCASLCKEVKMPMLVFNINEKSSLEKAVKGLQIGTIIN
ncbi:MAG: UMP kinase [Candidatus Gracilibacteria bacterium]|nr:UMP kinase [Candidatus Gracilibacteria bacterium]